eukprot:5383360-Prymnesium_polylepis.1
MEAESTAHALSESGNHPPRIRQPVPAPGVHCGPNGHPGRSRPGTTPPLSSNIYTTLANWSPPRDPSQ